MAFAYGHLSKLITALSIYLLVAMAPTNAVAQSSEPANCSELGAGFTLHPDFNFVCCMPGRVAIRGEANCKLADDNNQLQSVPPIDQGTGQQCIAKGQVCILNGTACCSGSCVGSFPNTFCQ